MALPTHVHASFTLAWMFSTDRHFSFAVIPTHHPISSQLFCSNSLPLWQNNIIQMLTSHQVT